MWKPLSDSYLKSIECFYKLNKINIKIIVFSEKKSKVSTLKANINFVFFFAQSFQD